MRIAGSYSLPFDQETAYRSLQDPLILARCVPGCDALEKISDDEYSMNMQVDVAGFAGLFSGKIKVTEAQPPRSFKILVEGGVMFGDLKGEGAMHLTPAVGETELIYDGDVLVGGAIAALGQRMIDASAKTMIRKFFERFCEEVKGQQ